MKTQLIERFANEKRWVNWSYVSKNGERTKVPRGSSTDPRTWSLYHDLNKDEQVGIIFTPDKLLLGIDIDHCLDGARIVHQKKEEIFNLLAEANTYTEYSPSGTGLHLFLELEEPLELASHKHAPFEVYNEKRFFTVTGKPYKEDRPVRKVSKDEAIRLLSLTGDDWFIDGSFDTPTPSPMVQMDDEILLDKMFASKEGHSIRALYNGDISAYKGDDSSADMGLCNHLAFWTGGNAMQMERLWVQSPLGKRVKTQKRTDYRQRTIKEAIEKCTEFYKGSSSSAESKLPASIVFVDGEAIVCKPIDWLWEGKIARGKLTLIAGDPGLGKSQATLGFAATVSCGGEFPGGARAKKGKVLIFSAEDDPADTSVPRLAAYGADLKNIGMFQIVKREGKEKFFDLSKDVDLLEDTFKKDRNISLVIIDPLSAFLGGDVDSHNNSEVRALLHKISKVAAEYGVAILGVTHFNKNSNSSPMNKFTGSLAFVAAARAAYIVIKDKEDEDRRLFLPVKNNLSVDVGGYAYRVEPCDVKRNGITIPTSKVVWEDEPVKITAAEALEQGGKRNNLRTVEWVEKYLKNYPGGVPFRQLVSAAARAGISERTLYRSKDTAFVEIEKKSGKGASNIWRYSGDDFMVKDDGIDPDDVPL